MSQPDRFPDRMPPRVPALPYGEPWTALGFDGSKSPDASALIASRMSDGRLVAADWAPWGEPDRQGVVIPAPRTVRRHRYGFGLVDIERQDAAQPLRTYSTPGLRERAANALLVSRLALAGLGALAVALALVALVLAALAAVFLGAEVVQWAARVEL